MGCSSKMWEKLKWRMYHQQNLAFNIFLPHFLCYIWLLNFGHMCCLLFFWGMLNVIYKLKKQQNCAWVFFLLFLFFFNLFTGCRISNSVRSRLAIHNVFQHETEFCHLQYHVDGENTSRKFLMQPRQNVV